MTKKHFLHEHPETARSWADALMQELLADERVGSIVSDQCEYGLVTPSQDGTPMPAKKPTRWASSSPYMLKRLSKRCSKTHQHQQLTDGRAKDAAIYPLPLILEILRGMRDTTDAATNLDDDDEIAMQTVALINSTFPPPPTTHHKANETQALDSQNKSREIDQAKSEGSNSNTEPGGPPAGCGASITSVSEAALTSTVRTSAGAAITLAL